MTGEGPFLPRLTSHSTHQFLLKSSDTHYTACRGLFNIIMIGLKRKNVNLSINNNEIRLKLKFDAKKGQFVHILLVPPISAPYLVALQYIEAV